MRVCLYQRISTDEDHQPTSLKTQRERLERYCEAMEDWRIVAAHEDQASGTSLDRPGLQQALDLAREKRIDLLLVYRVDRLSRKVRQLASLCEELDQLDVVLKSATEPFDTGSAAGRMMLQMLGVFAEFEHATIVDRISAGIERRAKEGRWFGGRPPFGYTFSSEERVLVPDPVKAPEPSPLPLPLLPDLPPMAPRRAELSTDSDGDLESPDPSATPGSDGSPPAESDTAPEDDPTDETDEVGDRPAGEAIDVTTDEENTTEKEPTEPETTEPETQPSNEGGDNDDTPTIAEADEPPISD